MEPVLHRSEHARGKAREVSARASESFRLQDDHHSTLSDLTRALLGLAGHTVPDAAFVSGFPRSFHTHTLSLSFFVGSPGGERLNESDCITPGQPLRSSCGTRSKPRKSSRCLAQSIADQTHDPPSSCPARPCCSFFFPIDRMVSASVIDLSTSNSNANATSRSS